MYYQTELFEAEELEEMQEDLNKFLLLLMAENVKKIIYDEKVVCGNPNGLQKIYTAMVIYIYDPSN